MASIGLLANDAAVDATIQPISAYNIGLYFQGIAAGKEKKKRKRKEKKRGIASSFDEKLNESVW